MKSSLIRLAGVCAAAFLLVGAGAGAAVAAATLERPVGTAERLQSQVLERMNATRGARGLAPLRLSRALSAAADFHSRSMASFGFFAHESPDGSPFTERVRRFYAPGRRGGWAVGENLLWSPRGLVASRALGVWMGSPAHRRNILSEAWREVGLAAVTVSRAPGVFGGRDVVIVTSVFGVRS